MLESFPSVYHKHISQKFIAETSREVHTCVCVIVALGAALRTEQISSKVEMDVEVSTEGLLLKPPPFSY